MTTVGTWWLYLLFGLLIVAMLAVDLFVFKGGKQHRVSLKEAGFWTIAWIALSLLFNLGFWLYLRGNPEIPNDVANKDAMLFLTGYLLEKALAIDNVFVWILIFGFFKIPIELQRRVLLYGILGAIFLRVLMIFSGTWLITNVHWILYVFGAFLIYSGLKMLKPEDEDPDFSNNVFLKLIRRWIPITDTLDGERFFTIKDGVRYATPLFVALVFIEVSDVVFAVDSIPAIFALFPSPDQVDPFIVLTSNLFAILGLRAMYFFMADISERFVLIKYGLAAILVFVGIKMLLPFLLPLINEELEGWHMPIGISLGFILGTLTLSIVGSLLYTRNRATSEGRELHGPLRDGLKGEADEAYLERLKAGLEEVRGTAKHDDDANPQG